MYGNYPTGYSYIAISISGRPDSNGRAVWEEGKDTAADKKPSLFFMLMKNVDSLATGMFSLPSFFHPLSYLHIHRLSWIWMVMWMHDKHIHTDNSPFTEQDKIKNTDFKKRLQWQCARRVYIFLFKIVEDRKKLKCIKLYSCDFFTIKCQFILNILLYLLALWWVLYFL